MKITKSMVIAGVTGIIVGIAFFWNDGTDGNVRAATTSSRTLVTAEKTDRQQQQRPVLVTGTLEWKTTTTNIYLSETELTRNLYDDVAVGESIDVQPMGAYVRYYTIADDRTGFIDQGPYMVQGPYGTADYVKMANSGGQLRVMIHDDQKGHPRMARPYIQITRTRPVANPAH
ncbi:MAG: hypothetical protein JWO73_45 [Candidatus Taylorbacteria bacterium]|nr:hypothetical protein [Candidatus Taylorbacteria bacterium]